MEKRSSPQRRDGIQDALESYRRFDFDYIPTGDNWTAPDGNFRYRKPFPESLINGFWRVVLKTLSPAFLKLFYGAKVVGKENLKTVKGRGALCVCNHFNFLDTLFVRQATGYFRSFHTMTQANNKKGFGGHIIRHGGMLPFSDNYTATKNLIKEMERLLKRGKIINFYAERSMWLNYQKPRPMKEGVFTYAVKFGVPIVPIFCTFDKSGKGRIKRLRINVLPPVFPDCGLPKRGRAEKMKRESERAWRECYERSYEKPLEYLPDKRKPRAEKEKRPA